MAGMTVHSPDAAVVGTLATVDCLSGMAARWSLRVTAGRAQIALKVRIAADATVADLADQILLRLTKPGGKRDGIDTTIQCVKDEEGYAFDPEDQLQEVAKDGSKLFADFVEDDLIIIGAAGQPPPGGSNHERSVTFKVCHRGRPH